MKQLNENEFVELSTEESMEIDGGLGAIAGIAIGYVAGVIVDGAVKATTGKSSADWVAVGLNKVASLF